MGEDELHRIVYWEGIRRTQKYVHVLGLSQNQLYRRSVVLVLQIQVLYFILVIKLFLTNILKILQQDRNLYVILWDTNRNTR